MSDEGLGPAPASDQDGQEPDQAGLAEEVLKRVRRSQSRRLAHIYADILSDGARKKSPEEEDREWQLAAKPSPEPREPGWGTTLKRGLLFALPLLVGPFTIVLIGHWLLPQILHRIRPEAVADLVVIGIVLSPVAFLIGMMTAK